MWAQCNRGAKAPAAPGASNDQPITPAEIDDARELCRVQLLFRTAIRHACSSVQAVAYAYVDPERPDMMNRIFPIEFEPVWFGGPPKSSWLSSIMMRLSGDRVPRLHATNPSWQTGVVRVRGRTDRELDYFVWLGTRYETAATARHPRPDEFADPTQALADYRRKYLEKMLPVKPGLSPVQQLKVT